MFDWESVVVHGTMYALHPAGSPAEVRAYNDAVDALRRITPETLREGDPVPFRSIVMRLELDQVTGRKAANE
jgi:nitroimidazol reductase NimA-like FMN-containing flavoprotein (pyridoxamine 5'-phosphate oxidase superfamily)